MYRDFSCPSPACMVPLPSLSPTASPCPLSTPSCPPTSKLLSCQLYRHGVSITASCWHVPPQSSRNSICLPMLWTTFPELGPDCGTPCSSVAPYYHRQGPVPDLVVSGSSPCTKLPFLDNKSASYALGPWPQWTSVSCCPHPCLCPPLFLLPGGPPALTLQCSVHGVGGRKKAMTGLFSSEIKRNPES